MKSKLIFAIVASIALFGMFPNAFAQKTVVAQGPAVGYAAPSSAQTAPMERPQLNVGDTWTWSYHDMRNATPASLFTETITSVSTEKITSTWQNTAHGMSGNIWYDKDFNVRFKGYTYKVYAFPLAVGDEWKFEYDNTDGTKQWHQKAAGKAVSTEEVTVPAGTFTAVKIVLTRTYTGSMPGYHWNGTVTDTWWYAPQAKNMVKRVVVDDCNSCGSYSNSSPLVRELQKYVVQ